uniref:Bcl-2 Bcl-2 homology region 1-3 domain-containing protein n=1 Tax=Oncorhynchus kisutch TaxID=8019 RepID=A0A8C7MNS2_ONCKI
MACPDIGNRVKATLKHLKVAGSIDSTPLFTSRGPEHEYRWGDLETDSSLAYGSKHFGVLGESANMYHLPNTVDTHKCFMCNLEIKNFVENDTLLGEHIFHVYNTSGRCKYLTDRYTNREDEMMLLLGKERYRRGKIAFPDSIITNSTGALDTDTRQLIKCVLGQCTGLLKPRWNESKALSTMSRVIGQLLEKHRYTYNGMINTLYVDDRGDNVKFLSAVAHSIFEDGTVNWGRVASKGRDNCVDLVGEEISEYLVTHHKDWLVKHNSWNGFVEFFPVAEPESRCRNIIMTIFGLAGIGATMTFLVM